MLYKNIEMDHMLGTLEKHLERRDKIGYVAARNTRVLRDELREFHERRDALIRKYGKVEVDESGNPTNRVSIAVGSPAFASFAEEIDQFSNIEHAPNLMTLTYDEVIDKLSGAEILELDWMLVEGEGQ